MGFLREIAASSASFIFKNAIGYGANIPEIKRAFEVLYSCEERDNWVDSNKFLKAYNVRMYDPNTGQCDIKIMKQYDFSGGYVLWNRTKNLYHAGVGSNVYKKVERHLRGYGNEAVYCDSKSGDDFAVVLFRLENTKYSSLQSLEKNLLHEFGTYPARDNPQAESQTSSNPGGFFKFIKTLFR